MAHLLLTSTPRAYYRCSYCCFNVATIEPPTSYTLQNNCRWTHAVLFPSLLQTFDNSDFHFATAAMETVDRKYGWGIDDAHHNITDGHVAHHLFFTKIPHYNLKKATAAIRPSLEKLGLYR